MSPRLRPGLVLLAGVAALAAPGTARAHAYLIRTKPAASATIDAPPAQLALTYDEAVEPRFMVVSVTDAGGRQETAGRPRRSHADPDTIVTPLRRVPEGWYLVFWRAISVDGHPVRGAFTFAVGPNPGPPPQFVIPSLSESATTPGLLAFRWLVFLSAMAAVGLLVLRTLIARPLVTRVSGASLRRVSLAFGVASALTLLVVPVYVQIASAEFAFRPVFDVGAVVPLWRSSAFGRAWLDFEPVFALFALAGAIAIATDRPERPRRSVAGLLALAGALGAATAALLVPALAGHAAQTAPKWLSILLDWLHLAAGSVWLGGLIGLLVLWFGLGDARRTAGLAVCVPRFSWVALVSVGALIGSGIGASLIHFPTFSSLWQTGYGTALIAKIGLLLTAMALASGNLLRVRPGLQAATVAQPVGMEPARLLRSLVSGEVLLVVGALFAAGILSSLPPPPRALASVGHPSARVGPGPGVAVVDHGPYRLVFRIAPNKAVQPSSFTVEITKNGKPVRGAQVTADFAMLDMEMPQQTYGLAQRRPGVFSRSANALVMVGHWGLTFTVTPPGERPFDVVILDHATG
jgi:copper transport protein